MSYSEKKALSALSAIHDPLTGQDIITAGRLADIAHKDGIIRAVLQIDPTHAKSYEPIRQEVETRLNQLNGITLAQVILTAHQQAPQIKRKSRANPHATGRPQGYQGDALIDHVIAVSSAKGGVGKSTIAVNLACALARQGKRVGLLDADIHGPSAPLLTGLRGAKAEAYDEKGRPLISPLTAKFGKISLRVMSIGYLVEDPDTAIVWRGPMVHGAMTKMLWDVDWGALDILIIDMPPGTGDSQLGLAKDIKPRGAVIVTTPQDLALEDARKGIDMFAKVDIPVLGLVENMSQFICPDCGSTHHIFGQGGGEIEAQKTNIDFLGAAPLTLAIRQSGDQGHPIAATDKPEAKIFGDIATAIWNKLNA